MHGGLPSGRPRVPRRLLGPACGTECASLIGAAVWLGQPKRTEPTSGCICGLAEGRRAAGRLLLRRLSVRRVRRDRLRIEPSRVGAKAACVQRERRLGSAVRTHHLAQRAALRASARRSAAASSPALGGLTVRRRAAVSVRAAPATAGPRSDPAGASEATKAS